MLVGPGPGPIHAAEEIDQSQFEAEEMYCVEAEPIAGCATRRWQTVTMERTGALVAVELYVGRQSYTTGSLFIEIRDDVDGEILATSDPVPASDIPVLPAAHGVRFTFPEPPVLKTREVFSIVIPSVSEDGDEAWAWGGAVDDPHRDLYAGGEGWECDQIGVCFVVGLDYAFATLVDTTVPASPPPMPADSPAPSVSALPAAVAADDARTQGAGALPGALAVVIIGLAAVVATGVALRVRHRQRDAAERLPSGDQPPAGHLPS